MTKPIGAQTEPVLVAIDISKARHEVLIASPDKKRRRRLRKLKHPAAGNFRQYHLQKIFDPG